MTNYVGPTNVSLKVTRPVPWKRRNAEPLPMDAVPILAVDPGGTTGWSLLVLPKTFMGESIWTYNQETLLKHKIEWQHGEIDCLKDELLGTYNLKQLIDSWPSAIVVMEGFQLRQMAVDLAPVRIIARIEDHLWRNGRPMVTQMPAMKATVNDQRLKLWNVYTSAGGLQHARDADRHALVFMRRCLERKGIELRSAAWPHLYGDDVSSNVVKIRTHGNRKAVGHNG